MKIGIGVSYYGAVDPRHRDSIRALKGRGISIRMLTGTAYPEMAIAELCRAALADELDVLVIVSHRTSFAPDSVIELAKLAYEKQAVYSGTSTTAPAPLLSFTAIPVGALLAAAERDERTYSNTGLLDTGFAGKSRPFASPWKRLEGSLSVAPQIDGHYLTPEAAFFDRMREAGVDVALSQDCIFENLGHGKPSLRMQLGSAGLREREGIRYNYAFCVPTFGGLDIDQQEQLWQLELAGCTIVEYRDCPYIDQARSYLTKLAMDSGHDGVFFLDHDIQFRPIDALQVIDEAEKRQDVVSAVYCMRKTAHSLIGATAIEVGTHVDFFEGGSVVPALYSGLGFSAIPRAVFDSLDEQLPMLYSILCGTNLRPYYALDVNGSFYSGEDASFCARVQGLSIKQIAGEANPNGVDWDIQSAPERALTRHKVWLDTRIRIFHRGSYDYGIEDHSIAVPRYGTVRATLVGSRKEMRTFLADKLSREAQEHAQGIAEGLPEEAAHSVLEEKGPCEVCGELWSTHPRAACPGYEEMTTLHQVSR